MDYRKFYEEQCNIEVPIGYEIHHIDSDRTNNDIRNLVMLPSKLHHDYHAVKQELQDRFQISYEIKGLLDGGNGINETTYILFKNFVGIMKECNKYVDYRDYLLGLIPNIHNFKE